MSEGDKVKAALAVTKDVLSALHLPGGETLGAAIERRIEEKRREALEVFLQEVENGRQVRVDFVEPDVPELAAMILRFAAASEKGAARANLKLLAQVIVGLKRNRTLEFDRFQKWANVLETLTRDEILVLAMAYRIVVSEEPSDETFWGRLKKGLSDKFSDIRMKEVVAGLTRTGLFVPASGWGELVYDAGPSLRELGELAILEFPDDAGVGKGES